MEESLPDCSASCSEFWLIVEVIETFRLNLQNMQLRDPQSNPPLLILVAITFSHLSKLCYVVLDLTMSTALCEPLLTKPGPDLCGISRLISMQSFTWAMKVSLSKYTSLEVTHRQFLYGFQQISFEAIRILPTIAHRYSHAKPFSAPR